MAGGLSRRRDIECPRPGFMRAPTSAPSRPSCESLTATKNSKIQESQRFHAFGCAPVWPNRDFQTSDLRTVLASEPNLHVLGMLLPVMAELAPCYGPVPRARPTFA
jgi:hypothetical protein